MSNFELKGQRTPRGGFKGYLYEDGCHIAKVKRGIMYPRDYKVKWFSEPAYIRFQNFCDGLSVDEALEAIEPSLIGDLKMQTVLHITGADVCEIELKQFTEEECVAYTSVTMQDIKHARESVNSYSAADVTTTVGDHFTTITVFNEDGEAQFFINHHGG